MLGFPFSRDGGVEVGAALFLHSSYTPTILLFPHSVPCARTPHTNDHPSLPESLGPRIDISRLYSLCYPSRATSKRDHFCEDDFAPARGYCCTRRVFGFIFFDPSCRYIFHFPPQPVFRINSINRRFYALQYYGMYILSRLLFWVSCTWYGDSKAVVVVPSPSPRKGTSTAAVAVVAFISMAQRGFIQYYYHSLLVETCNALCQLTFSLARSWRRIYDVPGIYIPDKYQFTTTAVCY